MTELQKGDDILIRNTSNWLQLRGCAGVVMAVYGDVFEVSVMAPKRVFDGEAYHVVYMPQTFMLTRDDLGPPAWKLIAEKQKKIVSIQDLLVRMKQWVMGGDDD